MSPMLICVKLVSPAQHRCHGTLWPLMAQPLSLVGFSDSPTHSSNSGFCLGCLFILWQVTPLKGKRHREGRLRISPGICLRICSSVNPRRCAPCFPALVGGSFRNCVRTGCSPLSQGLTEWGRFSPVDWKYPGSMLAPLQRSNESFMSEQLACVTHLPFNTRSLVTVLPWQSGFLLLYGTDSNSSQLEGIHSKALVEHSYCMHSTFYRIWAQRVSCIRFRCD